MPTLNNFYEQVIALLTNLLAALSGSTPTPAGGYVDVGSTPSTLPDTSLKRGVHVQLDYDASDFLFVGAGSATSGENYQLAPGESVYLEVSNANEISLVSSISGYGTVRAYWLGS